MISLSQIESRQPIIDANSRLFSAYTKNSSTGFMLLFNEAPFNAKCEPRHCSRYTSMRGSENIYQQVVHTLGTYQAPSSSTSHNPNSKI